MVTRFQGVSVLAACVLGVAASGAQPEPATAGAGAGAAAHRPVAVPLATIKGVQLLADMWGEAQRKAGVLYQDGALATPVPGGTLWTFGDSFTGTRGEDGQPKYTGALSNTMALLPEGAKEWPPRLEYLSGVGKAQRHEGTKAQSGEAIQPLALLASEDVKTRRLWPLAGVWLEGKGADGREGGGGGGGRAYMFYGLIDVTGPGPWGFKPVGVGLARAEKALGAYERLAQPDGGKGSWPIDASAIVRTGGKLYLYAPHRFKGEQDLSSGLLVARVDEKLIEDPTGYEFFAGVEDGGGAKWVKRVEDAAPAAEEVWGQSSVAWNGYLGAYVLATSSNIFRAEEIQLRTSATAWGPWTALDPNAGRIRIPKRKDEETQLVYCTMLHPELDEDAGRVMTITFCRMLKREWAFTNPEAVRVELEKAGTSAK